jgi:hypothetical protein
MWFDNKIYFITRLKSRDKSNESNHAIIRQRRSEQSLMIELIRFNGFVSLFFVHRKLVCN